MPRKNKVKLKEFLIKRIQAGEFWDHVFLSTGINTSGVSMDYGWFNLITGIELKNLEQRRYKLVEVGDAKKKQTDPQAVFLVSQKGLL